MSRLFFLGLALLCAAPGFGLERLVVRQNGVEHALESKVLVEAQDGGLLALSRDGQIWPVRPDELVTRKQDAIEFAPLSAEELSQQILAELPDGFSIHRTRHYLIGYNTSKQYAEWCGSLFERLHSAFTSYWDQRGADLVEPEFPLVALVFADEQSYRNFAKQELGDAASSIIGYYSFRTNRMLMYDLTGVQSIRALRSRSRSETVSELLSHPQAERTVATIIHEATHQIAFNCGLQKRYSDCPLWVSEGLAMYVETPDLSSKTGWRTFGAVNRVRLAHFQAHLANRTPETLGTLISDDRVMRDAAQAQNSYSEAWALTYFLIRTRPKEYQAYLEHLAAKPLLIWDKPETRLNDFGEFFGTDLEKLDREFLLYMRRLRVR